MRHIVICGLSGSTIRFFFHIIFYMTRFSKKKKQLLCITCGFWFPLQLSSEPFFILRTERDMIKKCVLVIYMICGISTHVKWPLFLWDFKEIWIFSTDFRKIHKCKLSWKSALWEQSCSIQTDGMTDMTKLIVVLTANAPKNKLR
jgi:hypothetical protein